MTKEELEKEAREYANKWLEEVKDLELYHKTDPKPKYIRIKEAYLAGAEPREKQIEIDAEHIIALQKQNGELTDKLTKAKELIKNIIRVTWGAGWNYSLDWKVKAEQFLSEVEK